MRQRWQDILFAVLAAAALVMAIFVALVWSGHFVGDGSDAGPSRPAATRTTRSEPASTPAPAATRPKPTQDQPVAHTVTARSVQILATRGDCWVAAHEGAVDGPMLVARVLREGERVTLRGRRIFLELGAAGNVDVSVNGKERPIPTGTTNVVVG
jgi:hypothetical protein